MTYKSVDTRLSKGFLLRDSSKLGKYSDASEYIYALRQDVIEDGEQKVYYSIARAISYFNKTVMEEQGEAWIEDNVAVLLDAVGNYSDGMMHHDTHTDWWELAVDSDEAAFTLFMLVVSALLKN